MLLFVLLLLLLLLLSIWSKLGSLKEPTLCSIGETSLYLGEMMLLLLLRLLLLLLFLLKLTEGANHRFGRNRS